MNPFVEKTNKSLNDVKNIKKKGGAQ